MLRADATKGGIPAGTVPVCAMMGGAVMRGIMLGGGTTKEGGTTGPGGRITPGGGRPAAAGGGAKPAGGGAPPAPFFIWLISGLATNSIFSVSFLWKLIDLPANQ